MPATTTHTNHPHLKDILNKHPVETIINRQYWVKVGKKPQRHQKLKIIIDRSLPYRLRLHPSTSTIYTKHKTTTTDQQINRSTRRPLPQRRLAFARIGFVYFLILTLIISFDRFADVLTFCAVAIVHFAQSLTITRTCLIFCPLLALRLLGWGTEITPITISLNNSVVHCFQY